MFQKHSLSLSTKFIAALLLISLIPLSILLFVHDHNMRTVLLKQSRQELLLAGQLSANTIDGFIESTLDTVEMEASSPLLVDYLALSSDVRSGSQTEAMAETLLDDIQSEHESFVLSYGLLNKQGVVVLDTNMDNIGQNWTQKPYFREPLKINLPYVSPVYFPQTSNRGVIYFSSPVTDGEGHVQGVFYVCYQADILQHLIDQEESHLPKSQTFAVLLNEQHIRLAHGTRSELNYRSVVPLDELHSSQLKEKGLLPGLSPARLYVYEEGITEALSQARFSKHLTAIESGDTMLALVRLKNQPWRIVLVEPRSIFLAPIRQQTQDTLLLTFAIVISVIGTALVIGKLLAGPILHLAAVARQIAGGNLTARAPIESHSELGILAATFNAMADQLQEMVLGLENQVAQRTADLTLANEQLRQEIIERKAIEEQLLSNQRELERLATTDALTGLYNRRYFFDLSRQTTQLARRLNQPLAVIMLDIDHFKRINDTYGHLCGDQVLVSVTRRCQAAIRETDFIGRYGGEEFAILLPQTDIDDAMEVAERLRQSVADEPIPTDRGALMAVTISVGVAADVGYAIDLETMLEQADKALFAAKRSGRNRVCRADMLQDEELAETAER